MYASLWKNTKMEIHKQKEFLLLGIYVIFCVYITFSSSWYCLRGGLRVCNMPSMKNVVCMLIRISRIILFFLHFFYLVKNKNEKWVEYKVV